MSPLCAVARSGDAGTAASVATLIAKVEETVSGLRLAGPGHCPQPPSAAHPPSFLAARLRQPLLQRAWAIIALLKHLSARLDPVASSEAPAIPIPVRAAADTRVVFCALPRRSRARCRLSPAHAPSAQSFLRHRAGDKVVASKGAIATALSGAQTPEAAAELDPTQAARWRAVGAKLRTTPNCSSPFAWRRRCV